jgi:hypothetical protein
MQINTKKKGDIKHIIHFPNDCISKEQEEKKTNKNPTTKKK